MKSDHARFDISQAAAQGYKQFWQGRRVFMHLAVLPVAVKIATFMIIMSFDLDRNYLRQGLLLLPSFFLEGWLAAVAIRYANHDAGPVPRNFFSSPQTMSCMILYVLAKLAATFVSGFALMHRTGDGSAEQLAADPTLFPFAFIVLAMGLWAFRLLWLYVPAALGYGLEDFLRKVNRFYFSFYLLGFWILCFVPPALILVLLAKILPHPAEGAAIAYIVLMSAAQGVIELCIILISALGFAYAVRGIMSGVHPDKKRVLR